MAKSGLLVGHCTGVRCLTALTSRMLVTPADQALGMQPCKNVTHIRLWRWERVVWGHGGALHLCLVHFMYALECACLPRSPTTNKIKRCFNRFMWSYWDTLHMAPDAHAVWVDRCFSILLHMLSDSTLLFIIVCTG